MKKWSHMFLAFIIGIVVGIGGARIHYARLFGRQIIDFSYTKVVDDVTTLTMLRQNEIPDLLQEKENDLNEMLEGLSEVEDVNSISTNQVRYLKMAASYRNRYHSMTGDTNVDNQIDDLLRKVHQTTVAH